MTGHRPGDGINRWRNASPAMPARDNGTMAEHTQLIDAINICTSIRSYDPDPIDDDTARQLDMTIDAVNMLADAHIQLVRDQPAVFADANASGHLNNAANYLAVAVRRTTTGPASAPASTPNAWCWRPRCGAWAPAGSAAAGTAAKRPAIAGCPPARSCIWAWSSGIRNGISTAWRRAIPSWWRSAMRTASRRHTSSSPRR